MKGHWLRFRSADEDIKSRLTALYFGLECCCGGAVNDDTSIRDMFRHIYHALRCRAGRCVWRPKT